MKNRSALHLAAIAAALTLIAPGSAHATAASVADGTEQGIVGGVEATENYPFSIFISANGYLCGASLIGKQWLITAKHCAKIGQPADFTIRIGSKDYTQGGEVIKGTGSWILNPNNDIALLKLARPAKNAPIPIAKEVGPIGTKTRIIGWGRTVPTGGSVPRYLRQLDTSVVDPKRCKGDKINAKLEICTDNTGGKAGACRGDSGGGQIKKVNGRWELIGVTSRGPEVCATAPSVYGSVPAVADWVKKSTGGQILIG